MLIRPNINLGENAVYTIETLKHLCFIALMFDNVDCLKIIELASRQVEYLVICKVVLGFYWVFALGWRFQEGSIDKLISKHLPLRGQKHYF